MDGNKLGNFTSQNLKFSGIWLVDHYQGRALCPVTRYDATSNRDEKTTTMIHIAIYMYMQHFSISAEKLMLLVHMYLHCMTLYEVVIQPFTSKCLTSLFHSQPSSMNVQWTTKDCTSRRMKLSGKTCDRNGQETLEKILNGQCQKIPIAIYHGRLFEIPREKQPWWVVKTGRHEEYL